MENFNQIQSDLLNKIANIRDRETLDSTKTEIFDALSSADKESIDFYEEWAVRKGQYGASAVFDEVEFKLDESKVFQNLFPGPA